MNDLPRVIITTELPPAVCGIGTYSWLLQKYLPNEWSTAQWIEKKDTAALAQLGPANVLLHYAARAYHSLGIPFGLSRALAKWKRKYPHSRLVVIVHELPASFPITSRHFWLGKLSERVTARLCKIADVLITNSTHHLNQLQKISDRTDIHFLPNPSNIEAAATSDVRPNTEFVVFGLPFGRWQTLQLFQIKIREWSTTGLLTKVHLIGPNDGKFSAEAAALVDADLMEEHGELPSSEVATLLRRAGFALTNASEETWSKSTSFMAFVSNECPVVVAMARSGSDPFSLTIGEEEVGRISEIELNRRTREFADWYRDNADWPVIAGKIAALWPNERSK